MWWALVFLAVFLIGLTKSGFGSGVGLMIVPMTAIALDHIPGHKAANALGLLLPLLIVGDFVALWQYRNVFRVELIKLLMPGTAVGVVAASALLIWVHYHESVWANKHWAEAFIKTEIGFESIVLVGLHFLRLLLGQSGRYIPKPWHGHVVGAAAGVSSTLAHAAGPIVALYLLPQGLERRIFVGACALYFFILNSAKIPGYVLAGQFQGGLTHLAAWMLPLVLVGAVAGLWLNRKMSDKLFSNIVYVGTFILGGYLLYDGLMIFYHS